MCTHLFRRGARCYIRRRVPVDLIGHYQKQEIQKALGTSDPAEARARCRRLGAELDDEFARVRASLASAPSVPAQHKNGSPHAIAPGDIVPETPTRSADDWEGLHLENQEEYELVRYDLEHEAAQRAARRRELMHSIRRVLDERGLSTNSFSIQSTAREGHGPKAKRSIITLAQLVNKWSAERKPDIRTVGIANKVIGRFEQYVGKLGIERINRRHVVEFKDKLLEAGQSPVNTDKQLVMLGTLLNFAVANLLIDQNPAKGVRVGERRNAREKRLPFDLPALQSIFSSPVYSDGERPRGGAGEAAYWLPPLALFTGARVEELGQLRPEDVYKESYHDDHAVAKDVWVLRITDEGQGQSLKNAGSRRRFPVHPALLQLGFTEFTQAQAGKARIFDKLSPDAYKRETANWSKWFGKYLRNVCKVTDKRMVFHSFRHRFKDTAREVGIPEDVSDAISGHIGGGVARSYGGLTYPLRPLVDAMSRYRIPGLKLPPRPAALAGISE